MISPNSKWSAYLLNLFFPGIAHIYWREYVFGIFIYLIMLIGVVLFIVSFFFDFSIWIKLFLLLLPLIFYIFTFVDLNKTINEKRTSKRSKKTILIYLLIALLYQTLSPLALVNFGLRNSPELIKTRDSNLSPVYQQGEILKSSQLAYLVNLFFFDRPVLHTIPERFEAVRFEDEDGNKQIGFVYGFPNETIELIDGDLFVNGMPKIPSHDRATLMSGNQQLTYVDPNSILVGTLRLGRIDNLQQITFDRLLGKVERLF